MPPKRLKENIFDLSKLVGKSNDVEIKSKPSQDYQDTLIGYELVAPDSWDKIATGSHIRYLRTDGKFVKGGFVRSISSTLDRDNHETFKIDLLSDYSPKALVWSIYKDSIDKLWKKVGSGQPQANNDLVDVKEDIDFLKKTMDNLKIDLQNTKNELMRTVTLIKKLHKV